MTHEEMISVIQAHKEGKQIQYRRIGNTEWLDTPKPAWNFVLFEYRIKPEPPKPKYRPFKDASEAFAEVKKHGGWIKNTSCQYLHILAIGESSFIYVDNVSFPYDRAYRYWVWADDGTPCGIKEE